MAKPFLRWVGGKAAMLPLLLEHVPTTPFRYGEPFLGGGALFFELQARGLLTSAVLADSNPRLIRCYQGVRTNWQRVAKLVASMPVERKFYENARAWPVDQGSDVEVAAWVIYVNFAGYGGLYRVNKKGRFNVPFDTFRAGQRWSDPDALWAAAAALERVELIVGSFTTTLGGVRMLGPSDTTTPCISYFDPPYLPESFEFADGYTSEGFGEAEHVMLAQLGHLHAQAGMKVIASNSAAAFEIWSNAGFVVKRIDGGRAIGARHKARDAKLAQSSEAEILAWSR